MKRLCACALPCSIGATTVSSQAPLRNNGQGRFTDVAASAGPGFALERVSRTLVAGDIDNDGDLDLLVTNNGESADLLRNDGGNRGNAVVVKLTGTKAIATESAPGSARPSEAAL